MADTPAHSAPWPIFLIGFMGSGKSTVGRALASELGLPFVDLDRVIEEDAGKPVAAVFEEDGEDQFRSLETAALTRVAAGAPVVVATGGGAPTLAHNFDVMRRAGLVVALDASLEEVTRRVGEDPGRPLWGEGSALRRLFDDRAPVYRRAHAVVQTGGRGITEVGRSVARVVRAAAGLAVEDLRDAAFVVLEERTYPIVVRAGLSSRLDELVDSLVGDATHLAVVTDDDVAAHYAGRVEEILGRGRDAPPSTVVVPAGETAKSLSEFDRVAGALIDIGLDRRSVVLALGGGVVGDLAGFVASTLFRGVRLVQVPTSLLAMVDSAIGGKTGINVPGGKNLIGSFWQPEAVLADPDVLATLPVRERRAACGELVKYALLDGDELFAELEDLAPLLGAETLDETPEVRARLATLIRRCAMFKAWVVGRDEREQTGERALLNLGHTVGHAIEAAAGYGALVHGEAVALGLVAACRVSAAVAGAEPALETRVADVLGRLGLDANVDPYLRDDVLERIEVDKKRTGDRVGFISVTAPGRCSQVLLSTQQLFQILRGQSAV